MSRDSQVVSLLGVLALAGVGLVTHRISTHAADLDPLVPPRSLIDPGTPSTRDTFVSSPHPFVLEVQGAPHILARISAQGRADKIRLQPMNGGAPVWEHAPGEGERDESTVLYHDVDEGLALVARGFRLVGIEVERGEVLWSTALSDEVAAIGRRDGKLVVLTRDRAVRQIDPASGAATPTSLAPAEGERLRSDGASKQPREHFHDELVRLDGLEIHSFLCSPGHRLPRRQGFPTRPPCTDSHGLLFARRSPGTPLPFLVGYDPETREERWRQPLSAAKSTVGITTSEPGAVWIGDDVVVAYGDYDLAPRIVRLGLTDGSIRWEKNFRPSAIHWNALTLAGDQLLFHDSASLWSLDPESGAVQQCIGPCEE